MPLAEAPSHVLRPMLSLHHRPANTTANQGSASKAQICKSKTATEDGWMALCYTAGEADIRLLLRVHGTCKELHDGSFKLQAVATLSPGMACRRPATAPFIASRRVPLGCIPLLAAQKASHVAARPPTRPPFSSRMVLRLSYS